MIDGLRIGEGGLLRAVTAARFGRQHLGHAPGGPQDRAAAAAARSALRLPDDAAVLEIVAAPKLQLTFAARLVLTGAPRPGATLHRADSVDGAGSAGRIGSAAADASPLPHATVVAAAAGTELRLGGTAPGPAGGWRTILALAPDNHDDSNGDNHDDRAGLGPLPPLCRRRPGARPGVLRLLPGPEAAGVDDRALLLGRPWRVGAALSDAGLRLLPVGRDPLPRCHPREIASAPLADGCVQLTPAGPVIFLRGRPTLGGYPRVGCLPESDVDRAAQLGPGACVRLVNAL